MSLKCILALMFCFNFKVWCGFMAEHGSTCARMLIPHSGSKELQKQHVQPSLCIPLRKCYDTITDSWLYPPHVWKVTQGRLMAVLECTTIQAATWFFQHSEASVTCVTSPREILLKHSLLKNEARRSKDIFSVWEVHS